MTKTKDLKPFICQFGVIYYTKDIEEAIAMFLDEWGGELVAQTDWTVDPISIPNIPFEENK